MPRPTIIALRQFYACPLGRRVKQRLRAFAVRHWPDMTQQSVVGLGYALPVLRVLERGKPASLLALMPAEQGAIYWPVHLDNRSVLTDIAQPPLARASIDRLVMMHVLEHAEQPLELLKTYWQLLVPGGRLLLIVPNRHGLWARIGTTPYRHGRAYHLAQVRDLLNDAQFAVREAHTAIFPPPSQHPLGLKLWPLLEWIGRLLVPQMGGVLVVEAEKQIYAAIPQPAVNAPQQWRVAPA